MIKDIFKKYFKKRLYSIILLLLFISVGVIMDSTNPYFFGKIIDGIAGKDRNIIKKYLICFTVALFSVEVLSYFEMRLGKSIALRTVNDIKGDLLWNVLEKSYFKTCGYDRGELLNRIEFDASTIVDYQIDLVSSLFMIVGSLIVSLYFLFSISTTLAIVFILLVLLLYAINYIYRKNGRNT